MILVQVYVSERTSPVP